MPRRFSVCFLMILVLLCAPLPSHATKPCMPDPCRNPDGTLDNPLCAAHAAWVAKGTLHRITHRKEGHPLHKDFSRFTLHVTEWLKNPQHTDRIDFEVGWCTNQQELPENTSGTFIFYGDKALESTSAPATYLGFDKAP